ncbi:MAG: Abi family protein [Coxiellaceae bacterium]|nr:Abi family protein [Coxiellaceae bacterium]
MTNDYRYFNKPSLSINEQIALLRNRGLTLDKPNAAFHFLKSIGYYRLMAYFKPFMVDDGNSELGFIPGVTFSHILQLYNFDRELRLLVTDALERIEVTLRVSISNTMSIQYGAHWYLDKKLFKRENRHKASLSEAYNHLKRSKEDFIKKYYILYDHPPQPPSWMLTECLSFGTISQIYNNIKARSCRKLIADHFKQHSETIKSWMRALTFTRNITAHHSRLWNRFFINTPKNIDIPITFNRDKSPFIIQAYIIIQLMNAIAPGSHWKNRLLLLFEEHNNFIPFEQMGFDNHWHNNHLWDT